MPPSFEEFAEARLDPLLRYATVLTCDAHLAKDVVQEVLIKVQQRWPRISGTGAPVAYVRRMILNEYLSWRRLRATRDIALAHADLDRVSPPVEDVTSDLQERQAMVARLATLPRKQRAAVVLRYYEGMDDAEIASTLGCTAGTVRSHISLALVKLRAQDVAPGKRTQPTGSRKGLDHAF